MNKKKVWLVSNENWHVICVSSNREYAKSYAHQFLGANPDNYTVTPLTHVGDRVFFYGEVGE